MLKLSLCRNCGSAYDVTDTDDNYCLDCPGEYDPEALEIVKTMRNIQDLDAE